MPNTAPYDANFTVPERLHVDRLSFTRGLVTIYTSTTNLTAEALFANSPSRRIQGCYTCTLADLVRHTGAPSSSSAQVLLRRSLLRAQGFRRAS
jgi:hypothetical protein